MPVLKLQKLKHDLKTQNPGSLGLCLCPWFGFALRSVAPEDFLV